MRDATKRGWFNNGITSVKAFLKRFFCIAQRAVKCSWTFMLQRSNCAEICILLAFNFRAREYYETACSSVFHSVFPHSHSSSI